jgi:hypothetical protein
MNGLQVIINVKARIDEDSTDIELEYPFNIADAGKPTLLGCRPADPLFQQLRDGQLLPTVVRDAGQQLYQRLTANPAIHAALQGALLPASEIKPIYIHVRSEEAEELPWEALCQPCEPPAYRFLSLEERNPVARIATPIVPVEASERFVEMPVRVAAVLSAAGVSADVEWAALEQALLAPGLETELLLFVGSEPLKVKLDAVAAQDKRVRVAYVPPLGEDLITEMSKFAPTIVHFFCHGSTEGGPHLQIASGLDWQSDPVRSSVYLQVGDLERIDPLRRYTWLVTLNCCLGAVPIERAPSLARSLVERGFPVAVGMREVLSSLDAPVFCQRFYQAIFAELKDRLTTGNRRFPINWAKLLPQPRRVLWQHRAGGPPPLGPEQLKEWTLPILYVQPTPFRVRRPSTNPGLLPREKRLKQIDLTQLKVKRVQLESVEDLPDAALQEIDALIQAREKELYPDVV